VVSAPRDGLLNHALPAGQAVTGCCTAAAALRIAELRPPKARFRLSKPTDQNRVLTQVPMSEWSVGRASICLAAKGPEAREGPADGVYGEKRKPGFCLRLRAFEG